MRLTQVPTRKCVKNKKKKKKQNSQASCVGAAIFTNLILHRIQPSAMQSMLSYANFPTGKRFKADVRKFSLSSLVWRSTKAARIPSKRDINKTKSAKTAKTSLSVCLFGLYLVVVANNWWCWSDATEATTQIRTKRARTKEESFRSAVQLELMLDKSMPAS